ncbi:hypothetical protein PLICRDRAFT_209751 [Plicaturopsis crispa FD-325 SS-3]|nr:hypothetical protein PLICRDRAFT_209751 [Plicaturopsis crispa FD-325 SS-3]
MSELSVIWHALRQRFRPMDSPNADDTAAHALASQNRSLSTGRPRPYILFLPTELLSMIFKHVHFQHLDTFDFFMTLREGKNISRSEVYWTEEMLNKFYPEGPEWTKHDDIRARNIFPYNLAAVCPKFRAILSTVPQYWTRLVIDIGRDATPLSEVRSYLEWSKALPLEVTVLRRDGYAGTDALEANRVAAVSRLLAPHFHRFKALEFRVLDPASLPTMGVEFQGTAPLLKQVKFTSVVD